MSCPGELHHLHTFDICESHRLSQGIVCKLPPGLYACKTCIELARSPWMPARSFRRKPKMVPADHAIYTSGAPYHELTSGPCPGD